MDRLKKTISDELDRLSKEATNIASSVENPVQDNEGDLTERESDSRIY
jgi:hypothetical protein